MLILQNARGGAVEAGKEKQQIVFKIEHGFTGKSQRLNRDSMVAVERHSGNSAERRNELILFADRIAQAVDFDLAGQFRQFLGVGYLALVRVQRLQQGRGKTAGGAEAGACWDISQGGNLNLRSIEVLHRKRFANDAMLDVCDLLDMLQGRIF